MTFSAEIRKTLDAHRVSWYVRLWAANEFLEEFVAKLNPPPIDVIEIGTCNGFSTLVLAKYSRTVFTFDATYRNAEYVWSFFPELRKRIVSFSGPQSILDATFQKQLPYWIKPLQIQFNFAFIDAEHTYEAAKRDFGLIEPLCNRVLFHDAHCHGVHKFAITELGAKEVDPQKVYGYWEKSA